MSARKLITISLPPRLLMAAERIGKRENRTRSELLREALRLYIETSEVRRTATREHLRQLVDQVQARTRGVPPRDIREVVSEAVAAARRARGRASA